MTKAELAAMLAASTDAESRVKAIMRFVMADAGDFIARYESDGWMAMSEDGALWYFGAKPEMFRKEGVFSARALTKFVSDIPTSLTKRTWQDSLTRIGTFDVERMTERRACMRDWLFSLSDDEIYALGMEDRRGKRLSIMPANQYRWDWLRYWMPGGNICLSCIS